MKSKNPWKTLKTSKIYTNPWIDVIHDEVITPGGSEGIYGKVHFKNLAIGIIPLDFEYNTWIIGQHRYPVDLYSWEIPAGGCPLNSDPESTAHRELKEETGLTAGRMDLLMKIHTSNAVCDELAMLYLARELELGEAEPEESEDLTIKKLPFNDLLSLVLEGKITDALTITTVYKVDYMMRKGLL